MTAAEQFAAHAIDTRFAYLPAEARHRAAVYILDSLGVGIAGSSVDGGQGLLRVASGWGEPAVSVWGRKARLSAPAAAFLNAWQMHNQEFDCLHEGAVVHAMASVLPAALAAAELRGQVSGAELMVAVAVGVDVAASLGLAARAGFRFFRPATAGGFQSSCCRRANTWSGSQGAGGGLRLATRASQRHDAGSCRRKSDPSGPGRIQRACRHAIL